MPGAWRPASSGASTQATRASISKSGARPGSRKRTRIGESSGGAASVRTKRPPAPSVVARATPAPSTDVYTTSRLAVRRRQRRGGSSPLRGGTLSEPREPGADRPAQQAPRLGRGGDPRREVRPDGQLRGGLVRLRRQRDERGAELGPALAERDRRGERAELAAPGGEVDCGERPRRDALEQAPQAPARAAAERRGERVHVPAGGAQVRELESERRDEQQHLAQLARRQGEQGGRGEAPLGGEGRGAERRQRVAGQRGRRPR